MADWCKSETGVTDTFFLTIFVRFQQLKCNSLKRLSGHINTILMGLAIAVIILHLFIPHDHHPDAFYAETDTACTSHQESETKTTFPGHCHALNDLAFDKSRHTVSNIQHFQNSDFPALEVFLSIPTQASHTKLLHSDLRNVPFQDQILRLFLLRAPPSLA
jgi:hypothetical protein